MDVVLSEGDAKRARLMNYLGFSLILLAFALPFISMAFGVGSSHEAGSSVPRTLGSLLVLVFVVWLVVRKRSALAKGVGRL